MLCIFLKQYYLFHKSSWQLYIFDNFFYQYKVSHNLNLFLSSALSHLHYPLLFFSPPISWYTYTNPFTVKHLHNFVLGILFYNSIRLDSVFWLNMRLLLLLVIFYPTYICYYNGSGCSYFYHSFYAFLVLI